MSKSLLFIPIFIFSSLIAFAIGFGEWQNKTPEGNTMFDAGGGATITFKKTGDELTGIRKWYFYKHHIIGITDIEFFVVDEQQGVIRRFFSEAEWKNHIKDVSLYPSLWTRWFSDNWKFYERMMFIIAAVIVVIGLPILVFLIWRTSRWVSGKASFSVSRQWMFALSALIVLLVVRAYLDSHPQSW